MREMWRWLERLLLPGIVSHYWHRKRWIESRCRDAIRAGFERVVIIGAGFDTLGLRLSKEMPEIEVIEVDHPATQGAKRHALSDTAVPLSTNLRFVAIDLGVQSLPADVFAGNKATMVVIEGVLMYLSPDDVAKLFDSLRRYSIDKLRIFFSFMTKWPDGGTGFRPRSWLIERWLALRSEPFTWALAPPDMRDFLAARGFRLMEMALTKQLAETETRATALDGENLVACEPV